jgi:hypothetical protein
MTQAAQSRPPSGPRGVHPCLLLPVVRQHQELIRAIRPHSADRLYRRQPPFGNRSPAPARPRDSPGARRHRQHLAWGLSILTRGANAPRMAPLDRGHSQPPDQQPTASRTPPAYRLEDAVINSMHKKGDRLLAPTPYPSPGDRPVSFIGDPCRRRGCSLMAGEAEGGSPTTCSSRPPGSRFPATTAATSTSAGIHLPWNRFNRGRHRWSDPCRNHKSSSSNLRNATPAQCHR